MCDVWCHVANLLLHTGRCIGLDDSVLCLPFLFWCCLLLFGLFHFYVLNSKQLGAVYTEGFCVKLMHLLGGQMK